MKQLIWPGFRPLLIGLVVWPVVLVSLFLMGSTVDRWSHYSKGNKMISRIETFRLDHGRLPDTLEEIGMGDPDLDIFYKKIRDDQYEVWFGVSLDISEVYDSRTRKWEEHY